ncbi:MAG: hypothetical protein HOQ05_01185 [Corynebacteriales bacterium]|nr:hypothetical protein [Mycobacteriales bacterium]
MSNYDYYYGSAIRDTNAYSRPDEFTRIPGDPSALRRAATVLSQLADRIITTNGTIDTGMQTAVRDWQSNRSQKFVESALTLTTATPSAEMRLRAGAKALNDYASALEEAQRILAQETIRYDRLATERRNAADCYEQPRSSVTNPGEGGSFDTRMKRIQETVGTVQGDLKTKAQQLAIELYGQAAQCIVVEQIPTPKQLLQYVKDFGSALGEPDEVLRDKWSHANASAIVVDKYSDIRSNISALTTWKKLGVQGKTGSHILKNLKVDLDAIFFDATRTRLGAYEEIQRKLEEEAQIVKQTTAEQDGKKLQILINDFSDKLPRNIHWATTNLPVPIVGSYFDIIDILDPNKPITAKFVAGLSVAGSACEVLAATTLVTGSTAVVLSTFGIGVGIVVLGWYIYENRDPIRLYLDSLWEPEQFREKFLP